MREQFDKELRDHIKDTFDVYDDGLADNGWKYYQRKERSKKHRAFLMWSLPTGIAAAITFFLLINFYQSSPIIEKTIADMGKPLIAAHKNEPKAKNTQNTKENTITKTIIPPNKNAVVQEIFINNIGNKENSDKEILPIKYIALAAVDTANSPFLAEQDNLTVSVPFDGQKNQPVEDLAQNTIPQSLFEEKTEATFIDVSANPNPVFAYTNKNDNKKPTTFKLKNVQFNIDASTFVNFSKEAIDDDVNVAVGVVSEYKLSKHFSINSGININRQTASYRHNTSEPLENIQNAMALTNSIASVINGHFTNAKLVGLDIPISFKYSTGGRKLSWFVSSGFSAYTLLNERYLNNFSVINYGFAGVETQNLTVEEEHTDTPFANFTLARTINISTGISFPIKNITTLSIEPFIKYPLKTVGQERLDLGSGGVSFKMNLNKNLFKR